MGRNHIASIRNWGAVVCGELIKEGVPIERGYNAATDEYVDMYDAGIIDPTKVPRTGLIDAASVAGMLTTSESMICDAPEEPGAGGAGGPPMGGMPGGMGGMM